MVPPPLLGRVRLTILALLAVAAVGVWIVARPDPPTAMPEPEHPQHEIPFSDVAPYGANFFLEREVEPWVRRQTVEMARDAGVRWARQQFLWSYIEPEPGQFEWASYDEHVDLYLRNGIDVIARLDWPPEWVEKAPWVAPGVLADFQAPPADNDDYARFVRAVVQRYRGKIRFYQIWNEPNLIAEWGFNPSHPVDPAEYVAMLAAAAAAAREVDPTAVILSAPLAINVESTDLAGNMSDLEFLEGMYDAGGSDYFDVLGANAFGMDQAPDAKPEAGALNFRRVELQRRIMEANGDDNKAVFFSEYGWNAAPAAAKEAYWQRVDERTQAAWTVDGVRWAEQHWPWSGVFCIWFFRQWGDLTSDRAVHFFRMVDVDFTPRRVYESVRLDAVPRFVAGPGVWAERSAPVTLPTDPTERSRWSWQGVEGASDTQGLVSSEPGAELQFAFRGTAVEARVKTGPQAGSLRAEVDGRLVTNGSGGAVGLQATEEGWEWRTLASDLRGGEHVLVLEVGTAGGEVALDAFRVTDRNAGGARPDELAVAVLGGIGAALALLLVRDAREVVARLGV